MAAAIVILVYLLFRTPSPEYYLMDPDGGVQLAAAQQIRLTGEQPWVDFYVPYGPLVYYMSFLGQWLSGDRLIGEIVLCILGYATAYLLLFLISHRLSESLPVSWFILICLLILMPRFYKYYVVLAPTLGLAALMTWSGRRGRQQTFLVGLAVAVAFLFRVDLGGFVAATVVAALAATPTMRTRDKLLQVMLVFGSSMVFLVPWVGWVASHGALGQVAGDLLMSATEAPSGVALPHPLVTWTFKPLSMAFLVVFVLVVVIASWLAARWTRLGGARRSLSVAAFAAGVSCLTMTNSRADLAHLLQGVPVIVVALSPVISPQRGRFGAPIRIAGAALLSAFVAIWLYLFSLQAPSSLLRHGSRSLRCAAETVQRAAQPRWSVDASDGAVDPNLLAVLTTIREDPRSSTQERLAVWPHSPQLLYFSARAFGGGTCILLPGLASSPRDQRRIVDALARTPTVVYWSEDFMLDGLPSRQPVCTHGLVHQYVESACSHLGSTGTFTVYECEGTAKPNAWFGHVRTPS